LPGLGKFMCQDRPERMVRNPSTGEQIRKPASKVAKFRMGKALKDSVA
jgi:DNA-binding protein HU-beta